ncbi:MAG: restriction endonuclease subunit S [Candidatus Thiodiazotropha sp.]
MSEQIPEGWTQEKLSNFCNGIRGVSYKPDDLHRLPSEETVTLLRSNNIQDSGLLLDDIQLVDNSKVKPNQIARPKDIAVCMSNGSRRLVGKSSSFRDIPDRGSYTVGAFCSIFRPLESANPDFVVQLFKSNQYLQQVDLSLAGSAINNLKNSDLEEYEFLCPPKSEQQKIASILTSVDEVIEKTESLISKLQDLKKGMMQELLTKGIGHTEFKDSPVGRIPKQWDAGLVNDVIESYAYGPRFNAKNYDPNGNVKTIRGTDVSSDGAIKYKQVPIALLDGSIVNKHALQDKDIVMITTADCGVTAVFQSQQIPYICSAYAIRLRPNNKLNPFYFNFFMQTDNALKQVDKYVRKGTVANLPGSDVLKIKFPLPSVEEQEQIVSILSSIDERISKKLLRFNKYKHLKSALMQDLLTGKVRVKTD